MWTLLVALCFFFGQPLSTEAGKGFGFCPTLSDSRQMKTEKFLGKWYVIASMDDTISFHRCGSIEFAKNDERPHSMNMTINYFHRTAATMTPERPIHLIPRKPGQRIYDYRIELGFWKINYEYWVSSTDYDSWALLYVCVKSTMTYKVSGYFMARERDERCLTNEQKHLIKQRIEAVQEWDSNSFIWQDQTNCD